MVCEDSSREPSPEPIVPPKRIVSKRKVEESKTSKQVSVQDLRESSVNHHETLNSSNPNVSDTVKNKLAELEREIAKFRSENNKLSELRAERESEVKHLRKEIETFQTEKTEELRRFE